MTLYSLVCRSVDAIAAGDAAHSAARQALKLQPNSLRLQQQTSTPDLHRRSFWGAAALPISQSSTHSPETYLDKVGHRFCLTTTIWVGPQASKPVSSLPRSFKTLEKQDFSSSLVSVHIGSETCQTGKTNVPAVNCSQAQHKNTRYQKVPEDV